MNQVYVLLSLALLVGLYPARAEISPELARALERAVSTGESLPVVLTLRSSMEIAREAQRLSLAQRSTQERVPALIGALQERFRTSFSDLTARLNSLTEITELQGYWAGLMLAFRGPPWLIRELSANPGFTLELDLPMQHPRMSTRSAPASLPGHAEPGLSVIGAPELWALGFTGEGVTIMSLDTGVDLDHPALGRSWRGHHVAASEAWFDPVYGTSTPRDYGINPVGHGTMTTGVLVGMDPLTRDTVGVAFGAEWIAAGDSVISISTQVACLQWALDPDGNPMTVDDMPDVVNCSWTRGNPGCKETGLTTAISALEAAGIAVVFSAGNDGPAPGSVRWPARMNTTETDVFAVGYVNGHDASLPVGTASGRGPTECSGGGNSFKPEVVAPGEGVRTTWLQGQYAIASGTSLSSPHVSGALALLKQAFPEKTGTELKELLMETARDLGEEGEDNDYGRGCIDVYAAYQRGLATSVAEIPTCDWSLSQNYPNPFNPSTRIRFEVPTPSRVLITVHSLLGTEVARLVDTDIGPGIHSTVFDGSGLASGFYVCRMITDGFQDRKALLLLR